jgi:hypothetical protein
MTKQATRALTMLFRAICLLLLAGLLLDGALLWAVSPLQAASEAASALPHLVRFSGAVKDLNGNPLTGVAGVTFALYSEQTGGSALWLETQNVTADRNGHYVALLGSTKPDGLPAELFISEQARWVGVQVSGQAEQPRVLLVSAPYAFKAGDAETIGGLPASAFVLANGSQGSGVKSASTSASASAQKNTVSPANPNVTGKGVVNYIPLWNTTSDIVDSVIFQKGSAVGINTTTPAVKLDVNGKSDIRDTLTLFPKGTDVTLAISGTPFKIDNTGAVTTTVLNATDANLSDVVSINSANNNPLYVATSSSTNATAIYGAASSSTGTAFGVEGVTASSGTAYGVVGDAVSATGTPYGVYGVASSPTGVGVFGQNGSESSAGALFGAVYQPAVGTWGDGGPGGMGVLGTSDDGPGGYFYNNDDGEGEYGGFTLQAFNDGSGPSFFAGSGVESGCEIDGHGNLSCTGTKNAVVPIDGGNRRVAMSAIESPQNWFEDVGEAELVNGSAVIHLDPDFIQTVNAKTNYKVFPVPNGDCKGLYVTNKTSESFEVRELGGGTSSIQFDYRIMALRKNYENVRFADHTKDPDPRKMMRRMKSARQQPRPSPGAKPESNPRENQFQGK